MSSHLIAGRYAVERAVGAGGMGEVFLGTDTATNSPVAIKVMKPELIKSSPEAVERFDREAEALRKLNHPNIVKVLATAQENGSHYIIMEYVGGGSLEDLLSKTPILPLDQVLNIALDLADALTRAHRLKIIHRDIKPANVLIAEDGTPRLTDFGVALIGGSSRMTQSGMMVGTLAYLPPEVLQNQVVDERADIWAFGIMLYQMLAGKHPFLAENTGAMLISIINVPTPDIVQHRADAPWMLMGLIYWMLEKDPTRRPQSTRLVGAMLENILSGEEIPKSWFEDGHTPPPGVAPSPEQAIQAVKQYTGASLRLDSSKTAIPGGAIPEAQTTSVAAPPRRNRLLVPGIIGIFITLVLIIGLLIATSGSSTPGTIVTEPTPTVANDEYMVLVAQPEKVGGEARDVQRFIVEDLRQHFERDMPFSNIRIRVYPDVIKDDDAAQQIAESTGASVIVWGDYDAEQVTLNIQAGSLARYSFIPIDRAAVVGLTNGRVALTSERRQSIAVQVLAVLNNLAILNGDNFVMASNLMVLEGLDMPSGEIQGNSVGAAYHRYFTHYIGDIQQAIADITVATQLEADNPYPYMIRGLAYQRAGELDKARDDMRTAENLGAKDWFGLIMLRFLDDFFFRQDYAAALDGANQMLEQRPDDWLMLTFRGAVYYLSGDYEHADADIHRALTLHPRVSFPFLVAIGIDMRDGNLADAQTMFLKMRAEFPDPSYLERIMNALLSKDADKTGYVAMGAAFGSFTMERWSEAITVTDAAIARDIHVPEIYAIQGLAQCNLRDYAAAEAAYSAGIDLAPDFMLLYLLRAEVRQKQGNILGAGADAVKVSGSSQSAVYAPLLAMSADGTMSCENFLEVNFSGAEATAEATEAS